jgi:TPR repeat protein
MDSTNTGAEAIVDPGPDCTGADLHKAGLAYSTGQGAPLCYVQAHKWFNLAALAGVEEAKVYRRELSELMSSDQIAEAQASARHWLTSAARSRRAAAAEAPPTTSAVEELPARPASKTVQSQAA